MTSMTPPVNASGRLRFGLRISPAILLASHQPPKLKKAFMVAPAMAGKMASSRGGGGER